MSGQNTTLSFRPGYPTLVSIFKFKELYDKIKDVEGDIVECGVAYGGSLFILGALMKEEGKNRKLYGLDSFEGFPEPTAEDISEYRVISKGEYRDTSEESVNKLFQALSLQEPILIKGYLEKTAKSLKNKVDKIAFLHVDVDLYSAYKVTLKELFGKVEKGGIVLFDEYNEPKFPGATKAVNEFFANTDYQLQKIKYINEYRYFVIKK